MKFTYISVVLFCLRLSASQSFNLSHFFALACYAQLILFLALSLCVVFFPNVVFWYCVSLLFKFLLYFHYPYKCVNVNEWLFSSALVNFIDWFNTAFDIIPEQKYVIHPPTLCVSLFFDAIQWIIIIIIISRLYGCI